MFLTQAALKEHAVLFPRVLTSWRTCACQKLRIHLTIYPMLSRPKHDFSEVKSVFKQAWKECWMRIFPFRTFRLLWDYPDASSSSWMLLFLSHFPKLLKIVAWFSLHLLVSAPRTGIPYVGHMLGSCCANFLWKMLLSCLTCRAPSPPIHPTTQLGSHILTYCYGF